MKGQRYTFVSSRLLGSWMENTTLIKIQLGIKGKCYSTLVCTLCWHIFALSLKEDCPASVGCAGPVRRLFSMFCAVLVSLRAPGCAAFHNTAVFSSHYHSQMVSPWQKILGLTSSFQLFFSLSPLHQDTTTFPFFVSAHLSACYLLCISFLAFFPFPNTATH